MKPSKLFFFLIFSIFLISSVSTLEIGSSDTTTGVVIEIPSTPTNYSTVNVNNSQYWRGLATPSDILHSSLGNLLWSVAGHTMDTNLDMNDNNIYEVDKIYFDATSFISSDDDGHIDLHAHEIDLHGNLSTIWRVRLNADSDGPTGTPYGELVFGSGGDTYLYYNGTDFIIDPDFVGTGCVIIDGNLSADYFFGSGAYLDDLNVSGDVYIGGDLDLSGYTLTTSFLHGLVGSMDMRGDPWYLSGTNLQVEDNITASYFFGDGSQLTGIEGQFNSTSWNRSGTDVFLANTGDSVTIENTTLKDGSVLRGDDDYSFITFDDDEYKGIGINTLTPNASSTEQTTSFHYVTPAEELFTTVLWNMKSLQGSSRPVDMEEYAFNIFGSSSGAVLFNVMNKYGLSAFKVYGDGSIEVDGLTVNHGASILEVPFKSLGDTKLQIYKYGANKKAQLEFKRQTPSNLLDWVIGTPDTGNIAGCSGDELFIGLDENTPLVWFEKDGNVGIGTTTPDEKLEVNGSIFQEDDNKHFFGTAKDSSFMFNGTDMIETAEVGAFKRFWIGFTNYIFDGDVQIDGDLNVTGKIHNSLSHMVGYVTEIHNVSLIDTWYNLTFNDSLGGITGMTFEDNRTIIIANDGHYTITFGMGFQDASPSPMADVGMRITLNGEELSGSYIEEDSTKQNSDFWAEHTTHIELNTGDRLNMQYIASDTDVVIKQDDTYAVQGFHAYGYIQEIII